ncbi:Glutamyl-tRNA(Gln) amidotransferase subunit B, mitochondrial, partial [Stegodyphus mimosarum]
MFFKKHCACLRLLRPVYIFPKKRHISSKILLSQKCEGATQDWECAVGLEVHAQINAKSKLFSRSAAVFGAVTNSSVSYFDAAYPGTLPVLNKFCVEAGILTALALNCTINKISAFDRKHYFYPDLPAGYQVTQHFHPLACNGHIKFIVHDRLKGIEPYECCTRLQQLQLEQDSGKSFHLKGEKSYVDLNRA